ncbi:MAG: LysR substrate-binding domain-containing protein [bacterium]|nr:LysR substrate-binding domain-containing protein [bacterium]MCY3891291.1 LysR substrate-binding domain-containing protein [bacterium]MCY3960438.1 LysR substrate-binding domain-containing protein [bacterium]MCY4135192.1 LysR substrate-binding domain-containing protein [bacterium]
MKRRVALRELENFVAVAEHGSMTEAAAAIGISQPGLSTSIRNLERMLGVSLLVRHRGQGVSLTPEGDLLMAEARATLSRAAELEARMSAAVSDDSGRVTVGSLVTVAPIVIPSLVRRFRERHPDIAVEIRTGTQDELLDWLRTGAVHAAITYDIELGRGVDFERILDVEAHAVVSSSHRLAEEAEIGLEALAGDPYILLDLPLSREYFLSLFLATGVAYHPAASHADISLVRTLVGNGFGFSLLNLLPATDVAQDGSRVAYVRLRSKIPPLGLGLARRVDDKPPRALDVFSAFARSSLVLPRQ